VAIIHEEELRRRGDQQATAAYETNRGLEDALWSGDQDRVIALLEADPSLVQGLTRRLDDTASCGGNAPERVVAWLLEHART